MPPPSGSRSTPVAEIDAFFITYDEPRKDESWQVVTAMAPFVQRVDSIKGFDRAHKVCASRSQSPRFFSIDGDNQLLPEFLHLEIPEELYRSNHVLSWSAENSINGLRYGNGGIKCWPKQVALDMRCHEEAEDEKSATDFCFQLSYWQMPQTLSISQIHHTPYQAFRSGFREGVKMALNDGEKIKVGRSELAAALKNRLAQSNRERLRIWCSIGADVENGEWAILGARQGLAQLYLEDLPLEVIRDYDWFEKFWTEKVLPALEGSEQSCPLSDCSWSNEKLRAGVQTWGKKINHSLGLEVAEFSAEQSSFFKSTYRNPRRDGLMRPN